MPRQFVPQTLRCCLFGRTGKFSVELSSLRVDVDELLTLGEAQLEQCSRFVRRQQGQASECLYRREIPHRREIQVESVALVVVESAALVVVESAAPLVVESEGRHVAQFHRQSGRQRSLGGPRGRSLYGERMNLISSLLLESLVKISRWL